MNRTPDQRLTPRQHEGAAHLRRVELDRKIGVASDGIEIDAPRGGAKQLKPANAILSA